MSAAKTNAERQREFRQRKADTEATEVRGIFAHPEDHAEVKEARRVRPNGGVELRGRKRRHQGVKMNEPVMPAAVGSSEGLGGSREKRYVGGRIVGGCSLHAAEKPDLCQPYHHRCPEPRCVDCCGVVDEHDILECPHCGKQWTVPCTFDEDYS